MKYKNKIKMPTTQYRLFEKKYNLMIKDNIRKLTFPEKTFLAPSLGH
jgi:hypothetical protein